MTRDSSTRARDAKTGKFVHVRTTIPPHVANVLIREMNVKTAQEAVEKILALQGESTNDKKAPRRK
jgi:acyl CoA:acetate/3-ketoacid CoA transferase beta subunit